MIETLNIGFLLDGVTERELTVTTTALHKYKGYTEKNLLFTDPQVGTFSVLILIPKQGRSPYPAIVGLHGHGGNHDMFRNEYFAKELAQKGFVVIMPSFRAMNADDTEKKISKDLLLNGFTIMGIRIYETALLIKYLNFADFVDDAKIGIFGHSGGSDTANIASRVITNLKAGIYDFHSGMLAFLGGDSIIGYDYHCEVVPALAYYMPKVNDHSTLPFPNLEFKYGYPKKNDKQKVIKFFKTNLQTE